jgi:hypothetical protein
MAYAIWNYGRTSNQKRQAAVMLYVHGLMGDARPGEVDPAAVDPSLVPIYREVADAAGRYHGPYRIEARLPDDLTAGREATATVRVLAAGGAPMADLALTIDADGATATGSVRTDANGVATVQLTPSGASDVRLQVRTAPLASTLPKVYAPTTPEAARNGQRLVAPDSQVVTQTIAATVTKGAIGITSTAQPQQVAVREAVRDRVAISGALPATITARAFGPFPTVGAIRCDGTPAWTGSLEATAAGVYVTQPATFDKVGWYVYQESVAATASREAASTPCTDPAERFRVDTQPLLRSLVSAARIAPGGELTDSVTVEGLADQSATIRWALYGPFLSRDAISCEGPPAWSGTIAVTADGAYSTEAVTVTAPGFYVYQETIAAQGFVRPARTDCADAAEMAVVAASPQVVTRVSDQQTHPGASISDTAIVSGLGKLSVPVQVRLWGPFPTRADVVCTGSPYWSGSFTANGDGTYTTPPVTLEKAGYYVYQESIAPGPANDAFTADCPETSETTFATAVPHVTTVVSDEVVLPGTHLSDRIRVTGLRGTSAAIDVELYGPFAARERVDCTGRPAWRGRVYAHGDGVVVSPGVAVERVGFYTFREHVVASPLVAETTTDCPVAVETALARPLIVTGRGDTTRHVPAPGAGGVTPRRLRVPSLGIDAPVAPSRIDVPQGVLGVPPDIRWTGWWADGATPGASAGAILVAGHRDSRAAGAGALFRLAEAHRGDRVQLVTQDGRTFTYRVVSTRSYPKRGLPADVYSLHGRPRLVVVTCGGSFDSAARHYRDNIVVTAVPAVAKD